MSKRRLISMLIALSLVCMAVPAFAGVFEVSLVPCTVKLCGADSTSTLFGGKIKVEKDGKVEVKMEGASHKGATLSVIFKDMALTETPVGDITTDGGGNCDATAGTIDLANAGMGVFFISSGGAKELVTGFSTAGDDNDEDDCDGDEDGLNDHDCDGTEDDADADDDNDGVDDSVDADDDNDGIDDSADPNPSKSNRFDNVGNDQGVSALTNEFKNIKRKMNRDAALQIQTIVDQNIEAKKKVRRDFKARKQQMLAQ